MIITPLKEKIHKDHPEYVPIKVHIENRADLLAVFLRIIRYFFQCGFLNLNWSDDSEESEIFIENSFMENPEVENPRPSVIISIGGTGLQKSTMGGNISNFGLDKNTKFSEQRCSFTLDITGRNKLETYKLSDGIATLIFMLDDQIKKHVPDLRDIGSINVSEIRPLNQIGSRGDSVELFTATINLTVTYTIACQLTPLKPLFTTMLFGLKSEEDSEESTLDLGTRIIVPEDFNK